MPSPAPPPELFPATTTNTLLAFQLSSWYPKFSMITPRSKIIRPLPTSFIDYLHSDGVFIPDGSENLPVGGSDHDSDSEEEDERPRYAFPDLDQRIRSAVGEYGAVFPKLNFSSPRDAAWVLPAGSPLKCVAPADVYLLLKSSDFVIHDLEASSVFDGCCDCPNTPDAHSGVHPRYEVELVLRKWYPVDPSREFRCFVRRGLLIAISQRDQNHYDFLSEQSTRYKIVETVFSVWDSKVRHTWDATRDYVFDVLLTRSLDSFHVLDFNPYLPRTDSLLFSYTELLEILNTRLSAADTRPILRTIDSGSHSSNTPTHQHNMLPREALELSAGRDISEFAKIWQEELAGATVDSDGE